jgi:hypothetical protein
MEELWRREFSSVQARLASVEDFREIAAFQKRRKSARGERLFSEEQLMGSLARSIASLNHRHRRLPRHRSPCLARTWGENSLFGGEPRNITRIGPAFGALLTIVGTY